MDFVCVSVCKFIGDYDERYLCLFNFPLAVILISCLPPLNYAGQALAPFYSI